MTNLPYTRMYVFGTTPCRPAQYPVDSELLKQRKCRTQALKQLLSIPPESPKTAPGTWRLAYMIAGLRSRLQIKAS
jgi:hypothetical protein